MRAFAPYRAPCLLRTIQNPGALAAKPGRPRGKGTSPHGAR